VRTNSVTCCAEPFGGGGGGRAGGGGPPVSEVTFCLNTSLLRFLYVDLATVRTILRYENVMLGIVVFLVMYVQNKAVNTEVAYVFVQ